MQKSALVLTVSADAIQHHCVAFKSKVVVLGHLVLALFDIGIGELDHLAAIGADKVVVVIAVVQFEDGLAAVELAAGQDAGLLELGEHQDRKSTRLNSSHVKISYAVFCLKKK